MAERFEDEDWTADDDAALRGALATLTRDVELLPLPDVRFVRARGVRRRRQRALALTAAAAAAAVVVGAVGFGQLGRDATLPVVPATKTSAPVPTALPTAGTTTSTTPDPLDQPGTMPRAEEWETALSLPSGVRLTPVKPFEAVECLTTEPGTKVQQEQISLASGAFDAGQVRFDVGFNTDVSTAAQGIAQDLLGCQQGPTFKVTRVSRTQDVQLFSYTAGDAGKGWFAVVAEQPQLVLINISEPQGSPVNAAKAQVAALADIADKRLLRYGTGASGSSTSTSPASIGPTGSTRALSQEMPVSGTDPVPSPLLFVAAQQWASSALTGDRTTNAGTGALEGSTAVASCETDAAQAGVGGRVGVVSVRTGTSSTGYVGRQRVQLDESSGAEVQQAYVAARLAESKALFAKGCAFGNGTVRSTAGPSDGTYRLDTVYTDGSPTLSEWVGVTAQKTPGAVSTVVITTMADPKQGFAELDRLLMLARQK